MPGFCLVRVAVIISVSQLGCFGYPVAVITIDSAQPRVLKNKLEFYSPALRECRYSWGSPITLRAVGETSGFEPGCHFLLRHRVCTRFPTDICCPACDCSCCSTCGASRPTMQVEPSQRSCELQPIPCHSFSSVFITIPHFHLFLTSCLGVLPKDKNELLIIFY